MREAEYVATMASLADADYDYPKKVRQSYFASHAETDVG